MLQVLAMTPSWTTKTYNTLHDLASVIFFLFFLSLSSVHSPFRFFFITSSPSLLYFFNSPFFLLLFLVFLQYINARASHIHNIIFFIFSPLFHFLCPSLSSIFLLFSLVSSRFSHFFTFLRFSSNYSSLRLAHSPSLFFHIFLHVLFFVPSRLTPTPKVPCVNFQLRHRGGRGGAA